MLGTYFPDVTKYTHTHTHTYPYICLEWRPFQQDAPNSTYFWSGVKTGDDILTEYLSDFKRYTFSHSTELPWEVYFKLLKKKEFKNQTALK